MGTVTLTLVAPTKRTDGTTVPVSDLGPVTLETRVDAVATYSQLGNTIAPTVTSQAVQNVPSGLTWYRATWTDLKGGPNVQAETSVNVPLAGLVAGTLTAVAS